LNDNSENIEITKDIFDIRRVFSSKNEKMARIIPGFVFNYLERVLHQDELNAFLYENRNHFGLDFVQKAMDFFRIEPQVSNLERVPPAGKYMLAANHPLGGMDGIALMHVVGKVRKDIIFPVNDILMNIPTLEELFIPINKHGSNVENLRIINNTFASEVLLLYFPAGLVSRKQSGVIKDLEWKKTFLTRSKRSKRNIIPVFIGGRNTNFFYNLANWRKAFRIKANLEMLYLVDEMVKLKEKNFKIIFGKEIPYSTFDNRFSDQEWSGHLSEHVYKLRDNPDEEFKFL